MPGIGIITNPNSKLNKRNPMRPKLLGYILGQNGIIEMTNSPDELETVAERFKRDDISILAINGGDGTISQTISKFIKVYGDTPLPKIALLRGGTMNVIALNLGIKGQPEKLLSVLLEKVSSPDRMKTIDVDTMKIDTNFGFLYADGTSALVLEEFYKNKSNWLGAALLGIRLALSAIFRTAFSQRLIRSRPLIFTPLPQPQIKHESLGVFASTIERLPLNLPMFAKGTPKRQIQAISVTCPPKQLVWRLPSVFLSSKPGIVGRVKTVFFCDKLELNSKQYCPYTLDGELYFPENEKTEVSVGPTVKFILL